MKATVNLYIGKSADGNPTFCVPASILIKLTPSLISIDEMPKLRTPDTVDITFESDNKNKEGWELLLYWAYNHELPASFTLKDDGALNALDAWILGERGPVPATINMWPSCGLFNPAMPTFQP